MKRKFNRSVCRLFVSLLLACRVCAPAALGSGLTNTWVDGNSKWENASNWSRTVTPSTVDPADTITNAGTVTIDASTVLSNGANGCMTISNLILSAPGATTNTLALTNAGLVTPLRVRNTATVAAGALVSITNSILQVDGPAFGALAINGVMLINNGILAATNPLAATFVGTSGRGSVSVQNFGLLNLSGLYLGGGGNGTLTLASGTINISSTFSTGYSADSTGVVWITGGQFTATNALSTIGDSGTGQLTVSNGTWLVRDLDVGGSDGSQGTLTVAGGTSTIFPFQFDIGGASAATGTVWLVGGQLNSLNFGVSVGQGGVGRMTVSNATWQTGAIIVGLSAGSQGTLTIAGGTNTASAQMDVGSLAGATGTVWMTGGQLSVTNSSTMIGDAGVGRMTVSNGIWKAKDMYVAYDVGSYGTLTVAGGTTTLLADMNIGDFTTATGAVWVTGGELDVTNFNIVVGNAGFGTMTVSNGTVRMCGLYVGAFGGGGVVDVNGGSVFNSGCSSVTDVRNGSLIIDGGSLTADFLYDTNVTGNVTLTNGLLICQSASFANGQTFIINNNGVFQANGGVESFADGVTVAVGGQITGCGTISGNLLVQGIVLANCGSTLSFTGGSVNNNGTMTAVSGTALNYFGPVVNSGLINATNGSAYFFSTLQNNGTILGAALTNSWTDSSAKWETAGDWSLRSRPSATDLADVITNGGSSTVTIDATTTASVPASLTISNLLVSNPGPGTNTLSLSNAGFVTPLHVGGLMSLSNNGAVIINNTAAQIDGLLSVGVQGGAGNQLIVTNGGHLVSTVTLVGGSACSNNIVLVSGTNSVWVNTNDNMAVRNSNPGKAIVVANGGKFVGHGVFVGDTGNSSSNTVLLTGPGSIWTNLGALSIGGPNYGDQFVVSNGASLYTANAIIGYPSGHNHSAIVTGTNSIWRTDGPIQIGLGGSGDSLTVTAGGSLIASNFNHTAEVIVDGATLLLGDGTFTPDNLIVTNGGIVQYTSTYPVNNGTVTVAGGTVRAGSNIAVAATANSTGTVNVVGGTLVATNGVVGIGNNGTITSGSGVGRVTVSNGTLVASSIVVGNTAGSRCDLTLTDGGLITDGGCPSGTNCSIVINSLGFTQTNGTVQACNSPLSLGVTGPSDTTVTGSGASDNFQYLYAGFSNVGTFTLAGGVVNICAQFIVGHQGLDIASVIATGAVWVTGGQLTMNSGDSIVGNSGVGQMTISNGIVIAAKVTVGNSAIPSCFGTLTLAGGTLTATSLVLPNPRSRFLFTGGWLNTPGITNSNGQILTLGNGVGPLTFNLLGGISSLGLGLKVSTNATLSGFGTITGNAVNHGLITSGAGALNFVSGVLTNYGTILTTGGTINFLGTVVNNGLILTNGGIHFLGGLVNNGLLLDPATDTDGDGMNNLWEALAGTSPINSASFFHVKTIAMVGNDVQVSWSSVGGKSYVVQAAPVSAGGSTNAYIDLSSAITAPGVGESMMSYTDFGAVSGPPRFYRVRLGP